MKKLIIIALMAIVSAPSYANDQLRPHTINTMTKNFARAQYLYDLCNGPTYKWVDRFLYFTSSDKYLYRVQKIISQHYEKAYNDYKDKFRKCNSQARRALAKAEHKSEKSLNKWELYDKQLYGPLLIHLL